MQYFKIGYFYWKVKFSNFLVRYHLSCRVNFITLSITVILISLFSTTSACQLLLGRWNLVHTFTSCHFYSLAEHCSHCKERLTNDRDELSGYRKVLIKWPYGFWAVCLWTRSTLCTTTKRDDITSLARNVKGVRCAWNVW